MSQDSFNYFIYTRCSTEEQKNEGYSHEYQISGIQRSRNVEGGTLVDIYSDSTSGKSFDRKQMNRMLHRLQATPLVVDVIFIFAWDRFGRNLEEALRTIRTIHDTGTKILSIDNMIDFDHPEWIIMYGMIGGMAQVESMKISKRTKDGMNQAMRQGNYCYTLPVGYRRVAEKGSKKRIIVDPVKGPIVEQLFVERYNMIPIAELYRKYGQILETSLTQFNKLFYKKFYTGYYDVPAYLTYPRMTVRGNHEALTTMEIYETLQARKRNITIQPRSVIETELFLKGYLRCGVSEKAVTGYYSTSKTKKKYAYYESKPSCRNVMSATKVHQAIDTLLKALELSFDQEQMEVMQELLEEELSTYAAQLSDFRQKIVVLDKKMKRLNNDYMDSKIEAEMFSSMIKKLQLEKDFFAQEMNSIDQFLSSDMVQPSTMFELLKNIYNLYAKVPNNKRLEILRTIFPEGISMVKQEYAVRTRYVNEFILEMSVSTGFTALLRNENGAPFARNSALGGKRLSIRTQIAQLNNLIKLLAS